MLEYDDWRHRAACRDEDPELFFPVSDVGPGARQADQAKAVCARCPVRAECLEYALDNGLDHGVFGGTTETERRELRRRRTFRPAA
jgi:WhiB family redox-sensing transcriptional regulator